MNATLPREAQVFNKSVLNVVRGQFPNGLVMTAAMRADSIKMMKQIHRWSPVVINEQIAAMRVCYNRISCDVRNAAMSSRLEACEILILLDEVFPA